LLARRVAGLGWGIETGKGLHPEPWLLSPISLQIALTEARSGLVDLSSRREFIPFYRTLTK
jgi:hypothetical protein